MKTKINTHQPKSTINTHSDRKITACNIDPPSIHSKSRRKQTTDSITEGQKAHGKIRKQTCKHKYRQPSLEKSSTDRTMRNSNQRQKPPTNSQQKGNGKNHATQKNTWRERSKHTGQPLGRRGSTAHTGPLVTGRGSAIPKCRCRLIKKTEQPTRKLKSKTTKVIPYWWLLQLLRIDISLLMFPDSL